MEPSCSRKYFDCNEGTNHVPSSTHIVERKTEIETGDELDSSGSSAPDEPQSLQNLSSDPIDEIEREDFEEENRLINQCTGVIVDARRLTSSSLSSANSSLASSSETICSLILNTKNEEFTPEGSLKSNVSETQSQLCNTKKTSTPDNCCLKKNHIYTMNFTPPKPVRPSSIPKYKLFEGEETLDDTEQRTSCGKNHDGCDASTRQSIDGQSDSSMDKCLDVEKNDLPSSNEFNLSDDCRRISDNANQNVDNTDNNLNDGMKEKRDSIGDMEQTGQGTSRGSDTKDLPVADDTVTPASTVPIHHSMLFSDYEDPDSGEGEEEEAICTCISNHVSEDEDSCIDNRQTCDDEMTMLSASDSEAQYHSADENSRLLRKRKVESPSSCSSTKKHYVDPTLDSRTTNTAEYPPEARHWLTRFTLWSGTERLQAIDLLIGRCAADQVRHMMQAIEPLFQRDFISLLPRELALAVLGYLEPRDLLRAAETCRYWRYLADDNLLWKEQCRRIDIVTLPRSMRSNPLSESTWKAAFMRQHTIEKNWLKKSMASPKILKGHDDHVITCLQFYGNKILSGSDDTTLKVWSALTGRCLRTLVGHTGGVWSSQMIGRTVISGSTDRTLRVWDANTGACLRTLTGHTSTVRCMHLFNDRVVSGSRDATLRVWSVPDGRCLRVLVGHMAAVRCVQYNGNLVVSGAYDYFVKIWNPETAECLHTLAGHSNRVYSLQFDGVHVVSGSLDTSIMVWDVESGALKHTLMGHQSLTSGMELRSNILVSGNADSTVKVWDIITGQCLHTLTGVNKHQSAVTCLQSNNRFVITSSDDGTVKLWDLKTGDFIRNLITLSSGGSGGVVWRIRASSTKLVCAVGSRNGTEETKLMVLDFDIPGACPRCDII